METDGYYDTIGTHGREHDTTRGTQREHYGTFIYNYFDLNLGYNEDISLDGMDDREMTYYSGITIPHGYNWEMNTK